MGGSRLARAKGRIVGRPWTEADIMAKIREPAGVRMGKGRIARTLRIGVSVA